MTDQTPLPSENSLSQEEVDFQRYIQIRDEIHDLTKMIPKEVTKLTETHKRLLAHIDVFKSLSGEVKDQIHDALHQAATRISDQTAKQLIAATQERLSKAVTSLEQAIQTTQDHLQTSSPPQASEKNLGNPLLCLGLLIGGLGLGLSLPQQMFLSQKERALQTAWPNLSETEKQTLKKVLER